MDTIRIEISGPEHSGKTTAMVMLKQWLDDHGVEVIAQMADPQVSHKESTEPNILLKRLQQCRVILTEMQTK